MTGEKTLNKHPVQQQRKKRKNGIAKAKTDKKYNLLYLIFVKTTRQNDEFYC